MLNKNMMVSKVVVIWLVLGSGCFVRADHTGEHQSKRATGVHSRCLTFCYAEYARCVSDSYEDIVCDDIDQYCLSTCLYFYNQGYASHTDCQNACSRYVQKNVSAGAPQAICDYLDSSCVPLCLTAAG